MAERDSITQFTDKYQKSGSIGKQLLKRFFNTIYHTIPREQMASVAEIGCGAGYSTKVLRSFFPETTHFFASDVDPALVALTRDHNPTVTTSAESIYSLNHPDNSFTMVFCLEVMEHLERPEEALKELARVTSRYAIISVPREPVWRILNVLRGSYLKDFGNTPGHLNHWSKRGMARFVSREFDVITVTSSLPWTIILAKKKS